MLSANPLRNAAWGLALPVAVCAAWEAGVRLDAVDPVFFPPPSTLAGTAWRLTTSGALPKAAGATLVRASQGFALGAALGILVGVGLGVSATARRLLEPSLASLYAMPKLALLPVFLLLLGLGEAPRLALIAVATFLTIAIQVYDGVRAIDPGYVELARNYGASRWLLFRRVYLPGALPHVFTGLRVTYGRALVMAISVELVTGSRGLGSMIWLAWQTFSADRLYVGLAAAGLLGFLSQTLLRSIERRLLPWRQA